jgi:hypothetical protein
VNRNLHLHPDGERFALTPPGQPHGSRQNITFVFNLFDELRRIVPVGRRSDEDADSAHSFLLLILQLSGKMTQVLPGLCTLPRP